MNPAMSCSRQTERIVRLSTSGFATALGTGVTRPTQLLDSRGVRNGIPTTMRCDRPAARA